MVGLRSFQFTSMDAFGLLYFLALMLLLAAIPSASVGFVVVSSATRGLSSGVAAALGIVAGDLIFVALALLGMTALAEVLGALFAALRYLGGAYLIWLGIGLIRAVARRAAPASAAPPPTRLAGTFAAALLLTLGDLKAIFFYASLFPLFVDLSSLTVMAGLGLLALTALSVGSVKLLYALFANRLAVRFTHPRWQKGTRVAAGSLMVGTGAFIVAKA